MIADTREIRRWQAKNNGTLVRRTAKKTYAGAILKTEEHGDRIRLYHATKGWRDYSAKRIEHLLPR